MKKHRRINRFLLALSLVSLTPWSAGQVPTTAASGFEVIGTSSWLAVPSSESLQNPSAFTLEAWFDPVGAILGALRSFFRSKAPTSSSSTLPWAA